jgi:flagellar motor switch protein FliN/FliY
MDDGSNAIGQDEIEALLKQAQQAEEQTSAPPEPASNAESAPAAPTSAPAAPTTIPPLAAPRRPADDIDLLMEQTVAAIESVDAPNEVMPGGVREFQLSNFTGTPASTEQATIDLIRDVELDMRIELGRTHMYLEDVLRLKKGAVVPLDKLAGDPVDIFVNGRLVARGEVLVLNDNFCIRVAELVAGDGAA